MISEGDRIDIADVLIDDYDPVADIISQFVQITRQGNDAILSVDADGAANGVSFTALAIIEGGRDLDLYSMIEQGSLVI